jgi:hypothetical protein
MDFLLLVFCPQRLVLFTHTGYHFCGYNIAVLKNRGEAASLFSQMVITSVAVADILGIILFTFTAFILKNGFHLEILHILFLFVAFFIFCKLVANHKDGLFCAKLVFSYHMPLHC